VGEAAAAARGRAGRDPAPAAALGSARTRSAPSSFATGDVRWEPAIDVVQILGMGLLLLIGVRSIVKILAGD
jgi:hypothetical protein